MRVAAHKAWNRVMRANEGFRVALWIPPESGNAAVVRSLQGVAEIRASLGSEAHSDVATGKPNQIASLKLRAVHQHGERAC